MKMFAASRSFHALCTHKIANPVSETKHVPSTYPTRPGESIYIHSAALGTFYDTILPKIQVPFVLVSGDGDTTIPNDCMFTCVKILQSPYLICWYAQNCTKTDHPKLKQLPIGLDLHTLTKGGHWWGSQQSLESQEQEILHIRNSAKERSNTCYANFQFLMHTRYAQDRKNAIAQVPRELVYYEPHRVPRVTTWTNMVNHKYVISPHGNGLDCHRTWEALVLGCIPIVKTSPLDLLYEGLPVLIVKEWSDVTAELLASFVPQTNAMNKLTLSYWNTLINGSLVSE